VARLLDLAWQDLLHLTLNIMRSGGRRGRRSPPLPGGFRVARKSHPRSPPHQLLAALFPTVKFGLIGAGVVGRMRAQVLGSRLVAVADTDRAAAERIGVPAVTEYRRLLDDPRVDAIIVATPAPLHRDMVLHALGAGKHVLCEKPLATTVEACREIVSQAGDRVLAVGFNHRYFPCMQHLKRAVASGSLGDIQHVRALAGHRGVSEFRAEWMYRGDLSGGGVMMDIGLHMTDLIRWVAGEITEVFGVASGNVWKVPGSEDHATATMVTAGGVPVSYHATWGEWKGYRLVLEIYGSRGLTRAYYAPMANLDAPREGPRRWRLYPLLNVHERLFGWEATAKHAFAEEIGDFERAVRGEGWGALATATDGLRAVAIAAAVRGARACTSA